MPKTLPSVDDRQEDSTAQLVREWIRFLPDLDHTALSVQLQIHRVNAMAVRVTNRIAEAFNINDIDVTLLMVIRRDQGAKPVRPSDLWRQFNLKPSAVTYRIDRLCGLGMLERRPEPSDGRGVGLALTPKGEAAIVGVVSAFNSSVARRLASFNAEERTSLDALLGRFAEAWEADIGP